MKKIKNTPTQLTYKYIIKFFFEKISQIIKITKSIIMEKKIRSRSILFLFRKNYSNIIRD